MCDEFTLAAELAGLSPQVSRRRFAMLGAAGVVAGCAGSGAGADAPSLAETTVHIPTPDGTADAFFVHPASGAHQAVIIWPDIAGLRDAFQQMARRLAADGHAVLVVNQYYRSAPAPVLASFAEWRTPEGQAKLKPMIAALSPEGTVRDAAAFVKFLTGQKMVDQSRKFGTTGYCMGGPFAVRTAFAAPDKVGYVGTFHGAALVSQAADSPHQLLAKTKAAYLIAIARNDDARSPVDKDTLRAAADAAHLKAEIEVYGGDHGWCVPDSPVYDRPEAERAWARLLVLLKG